MSAVIRIAVLANAAKAKAELKSLEGSATNVGNKFAKFRAPAAAALGAIGLGAGKAISAASDLNETMSKSDVIFGKNSAAMTTWASGAAKSMGLSKAEALNAASGFGDMFTQIGFAGDEAANMSKGVVQMSADLGSFNNLPTADVADKIGAAFRGEYDSLQALIPNINAARVESEAMAATGKKTAKDLTAQEKATAVLAIVQKDGARASGDFARTQNSAANQSKIASASAADLAASLGQQMLPAYTFVLQKANEFLTLMSQHQGVVTGVVIAVGVLAAGLLAASAASTIYNGVTAAIRIATIGYTAAQWLLNAALTANPIGIIVVAIGLLIAGLVLAWRNSETFRTVVTGAFTAVKNVALAVWGFIKNAAVAAFGFIKAYIQMQITIVRTVLNALKTAAIAVWNAIKAAASAVWGFIKNYITAQINAVKAVFNFLKTNFIAGWNLIKSSATNVWNSIKSAVSSALATAKNKFNDLKTAASNVLSRIKSLFSPSALLNAGRQLIEGLARGVSEKIGAVVDKVREGVARIKGLLPGSPIKWGPLKSWNNGGAGKRLMGMLGSGIKSAAPELNRTVSSVLAGIANPVVAPDLSLGSVSSLSGLSRSGGNNYQINVQVAPGGDLVEAGRQMTNAIGAYERAGGRKRA